MFYYDFTVHLFSLLSDYSNSGNIVAWVWIGLVNH